MTTKDSILIWDISGACLDTDDISDSLTDHFAKDIPEMDEISVGELGLKNLIMNFDVRRAHGPDNISSMLIIISYILNVQSFRNCLFIILCESLRKSCLPSVWKKAIVCPICNGGDRASVNNYRPISLT